MASDLSAEFWSVSDEERPLRRSASGRQSYEAVFLSHSYRFQGNLSVDTKTSVMDYYLYALRAWLESPVRVRGLAETADWPNYFLASHHAPRASQTVSLRLLASAEDRAIAAEEKLVAAEHERARVQSHRTRQLMDALAAGDWLGLELLAFLRSETSTLEHLVDATGRSPNAVSISLAKLSKYDAVGTEGERFSCTDEAKAVLENLERSSGISLKP